MIKLIGRLRLPSDASTSELQHFWRLQLRYTSTMGYSFGESRKDYKEMSCNDVQSLFLDQDTFIAAFPRSQGWFSRGAVGLIVRTRAPHAMDWGEAHPNEFLCTLAECGIPSSACVSVLGSSFTVQDIVAQAAYDYTPGDPLEFSAVALASYISPESGFRNKHGHYITFDSIVSSLTSVPLGAGTCHGTHVCYAVAALLKINSTSAMLSAAAVQRGREYLASAADKLATSQHADGAWRMDWPTGVACHSPAMSLGSWGGDINVTGHHLEWLVIAPNDIQDRVQVGHATQFLLRMLRETPDADIGESYLAWSHAARALLQWRLCKYQDGLSGQAAIR